MIPGQGMDSEDLNRRAGETVFGWFARLERIDTNRLSDNDREDLDCATFDALYEIMKHQTWTAAEDVLVWKLPAPAVAVKTGRKLKAVYLRRRELGIPEDPFLWWQPRR
jgi:hypothetical protein